MMKAAFHFGLGSHPSWLLIALALLFLPACATTPDVEPAPNPQNDAVDVGYGTADKEHITGSVATVSSEDPRVMQYRTLADMLRGQVPGVRVIEIPGKGISVRIRGSTSINSGEEPLWVLDGMLLPSSEPLVGLRPGDVDTITVLKDVGATAIYGSRGANGVILIKTKR